MSAILKGETSKLWEIFVMEAEKKCTMSLSRELEVYLACLLERYANQPGLAERVFAKAYLEAHQMKRAERVLSLRILGDECLLFAGLFPKQAESKRVTIDYFIQLGQNAYHAVSRTTDDLYALLASHFVLLTDILQTASNEPALLPLEAYERWQATGSERAYKILLTYTKQGKANFFPHN
jgi:hypothetical protein